MSDHACRVCVDCAIRIATRATEGEQWERDRADVLLSTLNTLSRENGWGLSVRRSASGEYLVTT